MTEAGSRMPEKPNSRVYDVAVIGGGIVGCAVARRFTLEGASVVLLEKSGDILAGASKGNSGLMHCGFDAPPGSLELSCIREGRQEYREIKDRLGLPMWEQGAILVAWDESEVQRLAAIETRARLNGSEIWRMDRQQMLEREPHLGPSALEGLFIPGEAIVDPWSAPLAYLRQAVENGADVRFNAEVSAGQFKRKIWKLKIPNEAILARTVINCAGLYGDLVDRKLLGSSGFTIQPRKGQFVIFDKVAAGLVRSIVLPVPTERTKGVLVARTIFGNVLAGPTAEDQDDRDHADTDVEILHTLELRAHQIIPSLRGIPVRAGYAGLRPATEHSEYQIRVEDERQWITVGGIRSTGLTSALGLAKHVFALYEQRGHKHARIEHPVWPKVPNLAEHKPRDWEVPGSEIICHCEMVTRREIETALRQPPSACDLSGLKRRTRATMGHCQGRDCRERIAALLAAK